VLGTRIRDGRGVLVGGTVGTGVQAVDDTHEFVAGMIDNAT
jgi:hypothetical protein